MAVSSISFGDTVRVVSAPETERIGIGGKTGPVYGETTPTISGADVIGTLTRDFTLNVYFEDMQQSFWLAEHLVELIDHGEVTTMTVDGSDKVLVRRADGEWIEKDIH
jgi:hypothetical protein